MGDVANQDEARRCLEIANANLASGNLIKAHRFAEKAMKLFPDDQACSRFFLKGNLERYPTEFLVHSVLP
jgi:hypothetical protein